MVRSELVQEMAEQWDMPKKRARELVDRFFDSIGIILEREGRLELRGFGVFEVKQRASSKGRIPGTGEEVEVPSHLRPTFSAGKNLKEAVNHDSG